MKNMKVLMALMLAIVMVLGIAAASALTLEPDDTEVERLAGPPAWSVAAARGSFGVWCRLAFFFDRAAWFSSCKATGFAGQKDYVPSRPKRQQIKRDSVWPFWGRDLRRGPSAAFITPALPEAADGRGRCCRKGSMQHGTLPHLTPAPPDAGATFWL